jgi:signal peptidase II
VTNQAPREEKTGRAARLIGIALVVIGLDQVTKLLVARELVLGQSVPVVPGLFHMTLVHNTGMAFGLLSGTDLPFKAIFVTLLSVLALGNIVDRIRLGYVIDFLDVFYRDAHWPAFNLADSSICVGVGLLILESLRHRSPATRAENDVPAEAQRGGS